MNSMAAFGSFLALHTLHLSKGNPVNGFSCVQWDDITPLKAHSTTTGMTLNAGFTGSGHSAGIPPNQQRTRQQNPKRNWRCLQPVSHRWSPHRTTGLGSSHEHRQAGKQQVLVHALPIQRPDLHQVIENYKQENSRSDGD